MKKYQSVMLVVLAGCLLMLLPGKQETAAAQPEGTADNFDLAAVERQMEQILGRIEGAGKLSLMLTLASGTQLEVATDESLSYTGSVLAPQSYDRSRETVLQPEGGGAQSALIVGRRYPVYQGALVVCQGAERASVRLAVTEAVSALTGLGADRISVVKG